MRALVTGCAGFVGSTLCDHLLAGGDQVVGVDCFTPYYGEAVKLQNLAGARAAGSFELVRVDLRSADLEAMLDGVDVVFHQAAQPGVRLSWDAGFAEYDSHNVLATQRLLEAARRVRVGRFVYASSSSVYGNAFVYPTREDMVPRPLSPYGVTKLAAEHLCGLYAETYRIPTVALRYFTVYGPRQRPDMALHRLVGAALDGTEFPLYGDGQQVRDFTYVDDVVAANVAAATADVAPGFLCNIAAGGSRTMTEVIAMVEQEAGRPVALSHHPDQPGDVRRTGGAIDLAVEHLGWHPVVDLRTGIGRQVAWQRASQAAATRAG